MKIKPGEDVARYVKRWNLRRLMKDRQIGAEKLADLYGCSRDYIYQLLRGDVGMLAEPMRKLATILQADIMDFMHLPPELGSPDFDQFYSKVFQASKDSPDSLNILNSALDLIVRIRNNKNRDKIIEHLKRQLEFLAELSISSEDIIY